MIINEKILSAALNETPHSFYPWSVLKKCKCGNKHPWLHGFKSYIHTIEETPKYRVVCHRCFRHSHKGTYHDVVKEWNEKN